MPYLLYSDPQVNLLKLNVEDSISFFAQQPSPKPHGSIDAMFVPI